jgi:hypothetical protein
MNQPQANPGNERADESVLRILRRLFWTLESNVEGVIGDDHIDFLHDLRVANRRTRTLLSQIKGVVPASVIGRIPTATKAPSARSKNSWKISEK